MKTLFALILVTMTLNVFAANIDNQSTIKCETSQFVDVLKSSIVVSEVCWDDSIEDSDDIISEKILSSVKCDLNSTCFSK